MAAQHNKTRLTHKMPPEVLLASHALCFALCFFKLYGPAQINGFLETGFCRVHFMRNRVIEDKPFAWPVNCLFTPLLEIHAIIKENSNQRWPPYAINVGIYTRGHDPMVVL